MKIRLTISFFLISFFLLVFLPKFYLEADPYFIFIVGGSASGKTTFARTLVNKLGEDQAFYISLDEYLDKRIQPESDFIEGVPNFDNPSMINWRLLMENIASLQRGLPIDTPIYDFSSWMPVGFRQMAWKPIVIIEGIHATQDELDSIPGLRVFINVNKDLRYQRRLLRDVKERNYPIEIIEKIFFKMTIPYEKVFLDPTRHKANIMIDNLDGEDFLEKATAYVSDTFERLKPEGYGNLKLRITYDGGGLYHERAEF